MTDPVPIGATARPPALRCKRVGPIAAPIPRRSHPADAGLDLHAALATSLVLSPGARELVQTGWAVEVPAGHVGLVLPRSGLARQGVLAASGVIDSGYTGPIGVNLYNCGDEPWEVAPGDRIAQLVIVPISLATPVEVAELGETARGDRGFGSTGA